MRTVTVVEDNAISCKLITTILEQMGYTVRAYSDGDEAWDAFEKDPTHIVVTDWLMPKLDGLALARRIRARKREEYTYIILLTANVQTPDNYYTAMEAGVDDFLEKPLDRDRLWTRLQVAERILTYTHRISKLESIIPICSYCHKVRTDKDYWADVETYLAEQTGSMISHSICPECYEKYIRPGLEGKDSPPASPPSNETNPES
jgi:DNA-binding response OmpR family regulator